MGQQEEELVTKIIPDNIIKSQRIAGFAKRNIIDGVVVAVILAYLIHFANFVPRVQAIVSLGVCGASFVLCVFGIKGMSVSECLVNVFISKSTKFKYHLRSIRYAKKNTPGSKLGENTAVLNESIAEKGFRSVKRLINDFKEKRQG